MKTLCIKVFAVDERRHIMSVSTFSKNWNYWKQISKLSNLNCLKLQKKKKVERNNENKDRN